MRRNIILCIAAFLFYYCLVEMVVAPLMMKRYLESFYFVRNVDHLLPKNDKIIPTNADGIRCLLEHSQFKKEDFNIIFLGDSLTFGLGVARGQAFPYRVEDILNRELTGKKINVADFGWVSASPILEYRLLKKIGREYNPNLIVLCLDMGDFHDDIKYQNMLERRGIYWFYDKIPITLKFLRRYMPGLFWKMYYMSNSNLPKQIFIVTEKPLDETRKYFTTTLNYIKKVNDCAKANGAKFILVILPRSYQYSSKECPNNWEKKEYVIKGPYCLEPFKYFDSIKNSVDFPIYSLLRDFQETKIFPTCFDDDLHWNENGHSVAANAIANILKREIRFDGTK